MTPTTSAGQAIPTNVYAQPSQDEFNQNQAYWNGYKAGQAAWIPNPASATDWWSYVGMVNAFLLPTVVAGLVDSKAVGQNSAMTDSRNWLYLNDPNSPHNKAS